MYDARQPTPPPPHRDTNQLAEKKKQKKIPIGIVSTYWTYLPFCIKKIQQRGRKKYFAMVSVSVYHSIVPNTIFGE